MARSQSPSHPFRGFLDVMSEMERMRNLGRSGESGRETTARTHATAWAPTADIFARGKDMVICAELAGVPSEDISISVSDGVLTITGERATFADQDDLTPYVQERFLGTFRRSMVLPEGVDEQAITARFNLGVVTITVPGAADSPAPQPHRVQIQEQ